MPKQTNVMLGGREYMVSALPIKASKKWRDKLAEPFGTLSDALTTASTVEVNQLKDISQMVREMSGVLLGSVDILLDLMFEYSPELAADREWLEENAYDEEALEAFTVILRLAFPLGTLLGLMNGRTVSKISSNSPAQNGASGLPASGPKAKSLTSS